MLTLTFSLVRPILSDESSFIKSLAGYLGFTEGVNNIQDYNVY